jgi:putative ABC transport system permease protein
MRTVLCVIGVALATTFVVAVGATTMRYATVIKEMNVLFHDQIMVTSKDAIVIQAIPLGGSMLSQNYTVKELQKIEGVQKAVPILFVTPIKIGETGQLVPENFTIGIPVHEWESILEPSTLKGNTGHFPTDENGNEVVVGVSLADQYNWTAGTELTVSDYRLNVSGILDTRIALLSRSIIMPLRLAQDLYNHHLRNVNIIAVKPAVAYSQKQLAETIEQNLDGVNALTEKERNDMVQSILAQIETWNMGIQTVIFLMSLILVMTVTIMSVSERRRDFATLDAIGAPLSYTFRMVLFEASLIGVLGGILGIIFGSLSALVLASLYTNIPVALFFPSVFEIVPPLFMLEMFGAVVAVCCAGGIIPAVNAARMRIAEVLRAEY